MAIDKNVLLTQINEQSLLLDNLIDSDDIAIAQASLQLNDNTAKMLTRLSNAGFDVAQAITRNRENKDKLDKFLREFS